MELKLVRDYLAQGYTHGKLYVNGVFQCYTLEDTDRELERGGKKVYGRTAIPLGKYPVVVNRSTRFKVDMPLLVDVPQFTGIRIHPGNTAEDTEGCILVGEIRSKASIGNSRVAYERLFSRIKDAYLREEEIIISIERA